VSLTTAAVMRGLVKGPELQCSSEIGELQSKLSSAISNAHVSKVPSRLHLSKRNNYSGSQLDLDSKAYLIERFGKHTCFDFQNLPLSNPNFIDWNGDGNDKEELYLEGQQCLVFHLGGIPINNPANTVPPPQTPGIITMAGFSNNQQNPALAPSASGTDRRQGPYFEFQSNRLVAFTSQAFQGVNFPVLPGFGYGSYPIYWDNWTRPGGNANRQPYAFFASYNLEGGGLYSDATHKYGSSDCPSLFTAPPLPPAPPSTPLQPYAASAGFMNPSSFQIISAGRDGKFGATAGWNPRTGTTDPAGADDQSNFSAHLLGVAP